jgi:hypothetical protein
LQRSHICSIIPAPEVAADAQPEWHWDGIRARSAGELDMVRSCFAMGEDTIHGGRPSCRDGRSAGRPRRRHPRVGLEGRYKTLASARWPPPFAGRQGRPPNDHCHRDWPPHGCDHRRTKALVN